MPPDEIIITIGSRIPAIVLQKVISQRRFMAIGAPHTGHLGISSDGIFISVCSATICRTVASWSKDRIRRNTYPASLGCIVQKSNEIHEIVSWNPLWKNYFPERHGMSLPEQYTAGERFGGSKVGSDISVSNSTTDWNMKTRRIEVLEQICYDLHFEMRCHLLYIIKRMSWRMGSGRFEKVQSFWKGNRPWIPIGTGRLWTAGAGLIFISTREMPCCCILFCRRKQL